MWLPGQFKLHIWLTLYSYWPGLNDSFTHKLQNWVLLTTQTLFFKPKDDQIGGRNDQTLNELNTGAALLGWGRGGWWWWGWSCPVHVTGKKGKSSTGDLWFCHAVQILKTHSCQSTSYLCPVCSEVGQGGQARCPFQGCRSRVTGAALRAQQTRFWG